MDIIPVGSDKTGTHQPQNTIRADVGTHQPQGMAGQYPSTSKRISHPLRTVNPQSPTETPSGQVYNTVIQGRKLPTLPGDIPADIPPGLRKLYLLAQEMSASPPPREIPQRPVQQSPQEILSQLAWEMARDSLQGGALDSLSNEDIRAMLEEIARRQSGETALAEADASAENGDEPFTDETSHGIIDIGRSLGAKAANYDVMDLDTGEIFHFTEGTRIQNVEVFAGKGSRVIFRNAAKYAERFGGDAKDWQHVKGFGILSTPDGDRKAEVHWVQCAGIGKFRFFVKEWLD